MTHQKRCTRAIALCVALTLPTVCACAADVSGPSDDSAPRAADEARGVDVATTDETAAPVQIGFWTRTLPDNTFIVCPVPWLITGYGRVGQCTGVIRGPWGTFGRVGFYNPDVQVWAPSSDWRVLTDQHYREIPDGAGFIRGFGTLATDFGPVQFVTKYQTIQGVRSGNWGNYNEAVRRYFPANNDWWPVSR